MKRVSFLSEVLLMPKVKQEYIDEKKKMIVDAAYSVCLRKPVETVTISDVIKETGLSQGAIYRYYAGLDEILADMVTKIRAEYSCTDRLDELTKDIDVPFEEVTYKVCDVLGENMEKHLTDIQKINFDFGGMGVNDPERLSKIMAGSSAQGNSDYLGRVIFPRLVMAAAKQGHRPLGDAQEISLYFAATLTGIEKFCILSACYDVGENYAKAEPKKLFRTFAKTIILMFGGRIDG
jgi:AcrR family transcriptional regulator